MVLVDFFSGKRGAMTSENVSLPERRHSKNQGNGVLKNGRILTKAIELLCDLSTTEQFKNYSIGRYPNSETMDACLGSLPPLRPISIFQYYSTLLLQ